MATSKIPGGFAKDMFKRSENVNEANTTATAGKTTPKYLKRWIYCSFTWSYLIPVLFGILAIFAIGTSVHSGKTSEHHGQTPAHYSIFKNLREDDKYAGLEALRTRRQRSRELNFEWVNFFGDAQKASSPAFENIHDILRSLELHDKASQATTKTVELVNNKLHDVEDGAMKILSTATTRFAEAERCADAGSNGWKNTTLTWLHSQLPFDYLAPCAPTTPAKVIGQETQMELSRFINSHTDIFAIMDAIDKSLRAEGQEFGKFLSLVRVEWTQPLGPAVCSRAKLQETCTRADVVRANDVDAYEQVEKLLGKGKEGYLVARQKDAEFMRAMFIGLEGMARFYDNPIRVEKLDDLWMVLQQLTDKLVVLVMVDKDGDRKFVR